MPTLKQTIDKCKATYGIPLTDEAYIDCFKEWLQQHPHLVVKIYNGKYSTRVLDKDKLLEELE